MRTAMRTVTDINFAGRTVDVEVDTQLRMTCNSDHISRYKLERRDLTTGTDMSTTVVGDGVSTDYGRGSVLTVNMNYPLQYVAGHDFMFTPTIYQRQAGDMSEKTSPGKYDVYMGAGKVQADSTTNSEVAIDKGIGFILAPTKTNSNTILVGGCVLRLNDRDLLIESYNPTTGIATVSAAKINGTTSTLRATTAGEPYKLITNYLRCEPFVFYSRKAPELTLTTAIVDGYLSVVGAYSQAQGTELQSWKMTATYSYDQSDDELTIEHEEQFNTTIADTFPLLAADDNEPKARCYIKCEITTQDGVTKEVTTMLEYDAPKTMTIQVADSYNVVAKNFTGTIHVWRRESNWISLRYIGSTSYASGGDTILYTKDMGYGIGYTYYVTGVDANGNLSMGYNADENGNPGFVGINSKKWSLQHLTKIGYHKYRADGDRYDFVVDVNPAAIATVTGNAVYGTEGRFPKYIHGSDNYEQGSFTALLGSITNQNAAPYQIEDWREFIAQTGPFLLKTENGEVKIVAITGDPTRQYGTSLAEIGTVRVTYGWTEVDDIKRAVIT